MSEYGEKIRKQVDTLSMTFDTVLYNNYKDAFVYCMTNDDTNQCNIMQNQLGKVNDSLSKLQALEAQVVSHVNQNKTDIDIKKTKLTKQKNAYLSNMTSLSNKTDTEKAAKPLREQQKRNMITTYFYLAYYFSAIVIMLFLFRKQYQYSGVNFFIVLVMILLIMVVLRFLGIPHN